MTSRHCKEKNDPNAELFRLQASLMLAIARQRSEFRHGDEVPFGVVVAEESSKCLWRSFIPVVVVDVEV